MKGAATILLVIQLAAVLTQGNVCPQNNPCHSKAVCEMRNGSPRCTCVCGYVGNGKQCRAASSPVTKGNMRILVQDECAITKNNLLKTKVSVGKEYTVKFDVYPLRFKGGWHNIIHFRAKDRGVGTRIPAVWFHQTYMGQLYLASAVNSNKDYVKYGADTAVPLDKWSTVIIKQARSRKGQYFYDIFINAQRVLRVVNRIPKEFSDVKVYASNPWNLNQQGYIRNLAISTGSQRTGRMDNCPAPECPFCDSYKTEKIFGCNEIVCDSVVGKSCKRPTCPSECTDIPEYQTITLKDGCCQCTCTTGIAPPLPTSNCPENCKGGLTKDVLENGVTKCVCQNPCTPAEETCPPPNICKDGTEMVQEDGCDKCVCSCKAPQCPAYCDHGSEIVKLFDCKTCECCPKPSCPAYCQFGSKTVTGAGCNKCECCTEPQCPRSCPCGSVTYDEDGCEKCKCCEKPRCPTGCGYGTMENYKDGCKICECCPKPACPGDCKAGTEYIEEDGCQKCVCTFVNKCPKVGACDPSTCEIKLIGDCLKCVCKEQCNKNCLRFKKGKCECCSSPTCKDYCDVVDDNEGCPTCKCPKCPPAGVCTKPCQVTQSNGCPVCKCPKCPAIDCTANCQYTQYNGCKVCRTDPKCRKKGGKHTHGGRGGGRGGHGGRGKGRGGRGHGGRGRGR